jgi:hypothetical protein
VDPELTLVDIVTIRKFLEQSNELCTSTLRPCGADQLAARSRTDGERIVENIEDLDSRNGLRRRDDGRGGNRVGGGGAHDAPFSGRRLQPAACLS